MHVYIPEIWILPCMKFFDFFKIEPIEKSKKSMENPISAIFDLAEDVNKRVPKLKEWSFYALIFVVIWLFVNLVFVLITLGQGNILGMVLLIAILITGIIALMMLFELRDFLDYFVKRHRAIKTVREGNPIAKIPEGNSISERYLNYLKINNSTFREFVFKNPKALQFNAKVSGERYSHNFNVFVFKKPSFIYKYFGIDLFGYLDKGYALFIKEYEKISLLELQNFIFEIEDVCNAIGVVLSRVVILTRIGEEGVAEDVYDYIINKKYSMKIKGRNYVPDIQIVSEIKGNYDFVPIIPEIEGEMA